MIKYPQIKFIYSIPYDRLLTNYENKIFKEKQGREVKRYIKKLKPKWNKINDSVCQTLEKIVGNKWREKEIKCYVVKCCKYSGISDPLTVRLDTDADYVIDALVHELAHILVSYNFKKYKKIEQKLKKQFTKENQKIILYIYINFLELKTLKKIFKPDFIDKIIKRALNFRGIGKAYGIVLNKWDILEKLLK